MFSPSLHSSLTVLRTLMQVVLLGQTTWAQLVGRPAATREPGGLPTHHDLYARNESAGHSYLLQSSMPYYHPVLAHQKHAANGSDYRLIFQAMGNTFFDQWDFFHDGS
ncbi:hypothetical protein VP01_132g2 [Puccinia sorghi]|uniref:Uncharacterized protein n=1 Tax=Puccinia sorghi TaxID=27349 RepID=A0A0L6VMM8_9BASI|nr:hypothetical protein VP01_132g2 [Puccinia sorghi]